MQSSFFHVCLRLQLRLPFNIVFKLDAGQIIEQLLVIRNGAKLKPLLHAGPHLLSLEWVKLRVIGPLAEVHASYLSEAVST